VPPFEPPVAGASASALEQALARYCATTTGNVVVDLSGSPSMGAAQVRALARMRRQLRPLGRSLVVTR
jgi:anti-anti-sigma regulatory factor